MYTHGPGGRRRGHDGHSQEVYLSFLDLIERMLRFDPQERIRPLEALRHPFLRDHAQPTPEPAPAEGEAAPRRSGRAADRQQKEAEESDNDDGKRLSSARSRSAPAAPVVTRRSQRRG